MNSICSWCVLGQSKNRARSALICMDSGIALRTFKYQTEVTNPPWSRCAALPYRRARSSCSKNPTTVLQTSLRRSARPCLYTSCWEPNPVSCARLFLTLFEALLKRRLSPPWYSQSVLDACTVASLQRIDTGHFVRGSCFIPEQTDL